MRLERISEAGLSRRQFLKLSGQAATAAAAPKSAIKGLIPSTQKQQPQTDPDVGFEGDYEFWEDMGLTSDDIENAIRAISNQEQTIDRIVDKWKKKGVSSSPKQLLDVIKGYLSTVAYNDSFGFVNSVFTGESDYLFDLTGKFLPKLTKQILNREGDHTVIRQLFDVYGGGDMFWYIMQNVSNHAPTFGGMSRAAMDAFRADNFKGVEYLYKKGLITKDAAIDSGLLDSDQEPEPEDKENVESDTRYEPDSWRTQSTEFESKLRRLL